MEWGVCLHAHSIQLSDLPDFMLSLNQNAIVPTRHLLTGLHILGVFS